MQKCSYCGADLPENSRFCGKCGSMQNAIATDVAATRNTTPPPSWTPEGGTIPATWPPYSDFSVPGSTPAWPANVQMPITPPSSPIAENEDERRTGIPPWSPLYGAALTGDALLGSGMPSTPGIPVVHGTPNIGSVPSVTGSPLLHMNPPVSPPGLGAGNVPVSPAAQAPANMPFSNPTQMPGNAPFSHPVQGPGTVPVSHPVQGPGKLPVNHPVQGPPTHQPPEWPGTQEHHPPHKPHRHHDHPARHKPHWANAGKVAGGLTIKTILIVVTIVVVVAAGGVAAAVYFLSRPQPLISVTSTYTVGNALVGASGTVLHISGQKFSSNSAITFLLDGHAAPGNAGTRSDANGNFSSNVTVTDAWSVGTHILTARDASNYSTKNSVRVKIVQPGQANTPGPGGAPPDDASFKVIAQIQGTQSTETEIVTGHPDPMGGTVCQPEDNGQPSVITTFTYNDHVPYQDTSTYSCAGSYKGGKLTLTEMFASDVVVLSEPDGTTTTCTLNSPVIDEQLSGSYTGNNTFSGTITYPAIPESDYSCNSSYTFFHQYEQVNWTGQVTDLRR